MSIMYFKLKFFLGNIWWFEGQNVNDLQFKIYICIDGTTLIGASIPRLVELL